MVDDLYRDQVMDHFKNPRNFGLMKDADAVVSERNASCGDEMKMGIKVRGKKITEIKFEGEGCAISIAFSSLLIERVLEDKLEVSDVVKMSEEDLVKMVGGESVSPARQKCLRLSIKALKKAVEEVSG